MLKLFEFETFMMVESGDHQLRLVVYHMICKVFLDLLVGCLEKWTKHILPNGGLMVIFQAKK